MQSEKYAPTSPKEAPTSDSIQKDFLRSLDRLNIISQLLSFAELLPAVSYSIMLFEKLPFSQKVKHYPQIKQKIDQYLASRERLYLNGTSKSILSDIISFHSKDSFIQQSFCQKPITHFPSTLQETQQELKWTEILKFYHQHDLDSAYNHIQIFQKSLTHNQINSPRYKEIQKIRAEYHKMTEFYQFFQKGEWIFDKEEDGVRLDYQIFEEEKSISVKIEAEIAIEIIPFLAIICEIDLQEKYVPFVYDSKELKVLARNKKAGYSKTYMPLLNDRESFFCAVGYDRMKTTKSIFLYTRSYEEDVEFQQDYGLAVPNEQDYIRLHVDFFILEYKPLSRYRAQVRLASKADLKLRFLPLFILVKLARVFAEQYFRNIIQRAQQFQNSEWERKVKEHPEMYDFFEAKIAEYFS